MTSKERAALRAQANSLEPLFQVGKGGVNDALIAQTLDAFRSRELLKLKVLLETAPKPPREIAEEIAAKTQPGIQRVLEHEWPAVDLIARLMGEDLGNQRLQQSSNLQLNPVFGIIRCDDIQLVIVEIPPGTEW